MSRRRNNKTSRQAEDIDMSNAKKARVSDEEEDEDHNPSDEVEHSIQDFVNEAEEDDKQVEQSKSPVDSPNLQDEEEDDESLFTLSKEEESLKENKENTENSGPGVTEKVHNVSPVLTSTPVQQIFNEDGMRKITDCFQKERDTILQASGKNGDPSSVTNALSSTLQLMMQQVAKEFYKTAGINPLTSSVQATLPVTSTTSLPSSSSSSSSSSSDVSMQVSDEGGKSKEELLPVPLSREEYRQKHEPSYYNLLVDINEEKKISSKNMDLLDDEIEKIRISMESAFKLNPKTSSSLDDYIKKYGGAMYNLLSEIKLKESSLHEEEISEKLQDEIRNINCELEKGYQESIMFMHPDYTMEKYCKSAGIDCHASSNLNIKQSKIFVITPKKVGNAAAKQDRVSFNNPTGSRSVFDIHIRNLPVISPAGRIDDYCEAYPNGNHNKKYSSKYPGQARFNVAITECNPHNMYGGSWAERPGKEGVITPYSLSCVGFDKLYEFNQHFFNAAWEINNFAAAKKKESGDESEKATREDYAERCEHRKLKPNASELEELIKTNKKKDFRMSLKSSFRDNDRGVRSFKGNHEIYRFETEDEKKSKKIKPYEPMNQLDRQVYYYPNALKREPKAGEAVNTEPLKRKYAISLRRNECPLFRAVTYEEYLEDRKNGLVDHRYRPFKLVPTEEAFIDTDDIVISLIELVPDSVNCRLRIVHKAFIWIGEAGKLDYSYKPLTKKDDLSKFFYSATKYYNRMKEREEHEKPCDPYTLQEDINHLETINKEEDEFKNKSAPAKTN